MCRRKDVSGHSMLKEIRNAQQTHTHTLMEEPRQQFGLQYLAQGHFDVKTRGDGDRTTVFPKDRCFLLCQPTATQLIIILITIKILVTLTMT